MSLYINAGLRKRVKSTIFYDPAFRFAFFVSLAVALITHYFALTNVLFNGDANYYSPVVASHQFEVRIGKWMYLFLPHYRGMFALSSVNGLVALVMLSFCVAIIVQVFQLKSKINIFLVAAVVVTFPQITAYMCMPFVSDIQIGFSYLFSALCFYFATKEPGKILNIVLSSLFLSFTMGIYPPYVIIPTVLLW